MVTQSQPGLDGASVVIRCDANADIGVGHAMRCLALVEMWCELGGRVIVATAGVPVTIAARFEAIGARVVAVADAQQTAAVARDAAARYGVVDGYHLGADEQAALVAAGARLLVIDDGGRTATSAAHLVLDQNASASAASYAGLSAELLLGVRHVLLRREFRDPALARATPAVARRVLVSFGGADPRDVTPRVIDALAPLDLDVVVIAGPANARRLTAPAGARATFDIVGPTDEMATRMRWAELAVIAAGGTCWELAASGVPMIAVAVADNQREVTRGITALGIGIAMPLEHATVEALRAHVVALSADEHARTEMSRKGSEAIDGLGAHRACVALYGGST